MAQKKINVEELDNAINSFNTAKILLEEEIAELNSFIVKLSNDWESPASAAYISKMNGQIKALRDALRVIEELGNFSNGVKTSFEMTDSFMKKFTTSIPDKK